MSSPCSGNSPKGDGALCDLPEACKRIGKYEARFRSAGAELARRYTPHVHFAETDSDMEDFARECASAAIVAGSELGVAWAGRIGTLLLMSLAWSWLNQSVLCVSYSCEFGVNHHEECHYRILLQYMFSFSSGCTALNFPARKFLRNSSPSLPTRKKLFITELTDLLQRFLFLFGVREAMPLEQKFFCMFIIVCLLRLNLSHRESISS